MFSAINRGTGQHRRVSPRSSFQRSAATGTSLASLLCKIVAKMTQILRKVKSKILNSWTEKRKPGNNLSWTVS